ncbi:arsenate reductase family protein [Psychroserpens algicola]|uniref:Arsenate reductase n=1 Tax=Psychroserpens algicola TaxID=1719034 RepID=A0ABT0HDZ4_9FLAO|nr:hypothetical protein [Psychroserpens algicola]MCK8482047.1 hypothetical protein [Psychroserpens algicola]
MIKIYYSSESSVGKQTYAYLNASFKDLLAIDVTKTNVTGTQWKELAQQLNIKIGDLVDHEHPTFTKNYDKDASLIEDDWIKLLNKTPEILNYPIVILGDAYIQIKNPSDIEKKLDPNSMGLDEKTSI